HQIALADVAVGEVHGLHGSFSRGNERNRFSKNGASPRPESGVSTVSGSISTRAAYSRCQSAMRSASGGVASSRSGHAGQLTRVASSMAAPGPAVNFGRADMSPVRPRIAITAQSQVPNARAN